MAIITSDYLRSVTGGLRRLYNEALKNPQFEEEGRLNINDIMMRMSSNSKTENWDWSGFPAPIQEWNDRRERKGLNFFRITIDNKKYGTAIPVEREALEDDQLDLIKPKVNLLSVRVNEFNEKKGIALLESGFSAVCYDSQYFFDTDHSEGDSGTQVNKSSNALTKANIITARQGGRKLLDDMGEKLPQNYNLLVVGPDNYELAQETINTLGYMGSTTADVLKPNYNALHNQVDVRWSPYISGNHWYLFNTRFPLKPLIYTDRISPEFTALDNLNDTQVVENDEFTYGVRLRRGFGFGLWYTAYGSNN